MFFFEFCEFFKNILFTEQLRRNAFFCSSTHFSAFAIYWIRKSYHFPEFNHSNKKRKDSLETRAVFSWILISTEISGVVGAALH